MYVVEYHGHSVTWCLRQPDIARNHGFEDLVAEKAPQIGRNLLRERRTVVIHRKQDTFDFQRRINRAPEPHQRVQQL